MIEISYQNVTNGINHGINMKLICSSRYQADYLFKNACDLWYIKDFATYNKSNLSLTYGVNPVFIQCVSILNLTMEQVHGFTGAFLTHPSLISDVGSFPFNEIIQAMDYHNTRYIDKWPA